MTKKKTEETGIKEEENIEEPEPEEEDKTEEKEETEDALKKAEEERDSYLDMLRRERADFENYKKRNATLASSSYLNGNIDILDKILPVLDNFERALADADPEDPFVKGVTMIQRQLCEALRSAGVIELDVLGEEFNPETMNAVMQTECKDGEEPGMVSEVMQKGYKIQDRIIRHAMVKVTK